MSASFARFLSVVLHPVLIPSYAVWFLLHGEFYFSFNTSPAEQLGIYLIVVINTLILPVLIANLLIQKGVIRTLEMEDKKERRWPFFLNIVFQLLACYLMYRLNLPPIYLQIIFGALMATTFAFLISFFWKISIHMIGIGGLAGILLGIAFVALTDLTLPIVICIFFAGLLGTARLTLRAHQPAQIYVGFAIGFLSEFLLYFN